MKRINCRLAYLVDAWNLKVSETGRGERMNRARIIRETGLAPMTVSKLLSDSVRRIDFETMERLCQLFDCTPGDLFLMREDEEAFDD